MGVNPAGSFPPVTGWRSRGKLANAIGMMQKLMGSASVEGGLNGPRGGARPELLAPAGDWECAKAAVENGADAIYFGLEQFNARMRAHNFTEADLPKLMEFLHRRGVKGYVTFNTLVFAERTGRGGKLSARDHRRRRGRGHRAGRGHLPVDPAALAGFSDPRLDANDRHQRGGGGICPRTGLQPRRAGARMFDRGDRKNQSAHIRHCALALPLEVFVHGALCVAYSGQCLTSESLGGRSANRGECAQACRMPYDLISDGKQVPLGDRRYLLSPQDLAGLEVLPELVRAGVASLKIEGRLKSPEYVANITRVYRQALDHLRFAMTIYAPRTNPRVNRESKSQI